MLATKRASVTVLFWISIIAAVPLVLSFVERRTLSQGVHRQQQHRFDTTMCSSMEDVNAKHDDRESQRPIKVVVVGAGISGLSVAYHLQKLSREDSQLCFDVEILEARNRIGGRIHPVRLMQDDRQDEEKDEQAAPFVDLGGQWVHETCLNNPIVRLLQDDLDLEFVDEAKSSSSSSKDRFETKHRKNVLFDADGRGKRLDQAAVQKAKRLYYKALDHDLDLKNSSFDISFRDLLNDQLETEGISRFDEQALQKALGYFIHRCEGYEGGRFHEVSAVLADVLYEGAGEGPDRVVQGSYNSLLEAVSKKLGLVEESTTTPQEEDQRCTITLRSSTRVDKIDYDQPNNKIALSITKDLDSVDSSSISSLVECDYCVCTVPLGVLQQRKIEFVPPLSQTRLDAIDSIGMGILNKIVFRFDFDVCDKDDDNYKFWGNLLQFGICHENPALLKSYYDCTDDYYDSSSNSNSSNEKKRSAVLIQLLAGEAADRIDPPLSNNQNNDNTTASASLTDQQAIEESLEALRSVFGEDNVPDPAVSKVTRWRQDPWSCGSYSFAKVGSTPESYDEISSPLGGSGGDKNKNLLFAGEHTSKTCHSTVHGAWETGEREANRIVREQQQLLLLAQRVQEQK